MYIKKFESDISNDIIQISIDKNQCAYFKIIQFDTINDNVNLIKEINQFLRQKHINWVVFNKLNEYELPTNALAYKNKKYKTLNCHVDNFYEFYLLNISKFISYSPIYIPSVIEIDGWTTIVDKKKEKKFKQKKLLKEAQLINI